MFSPTLLPAPGLVQGVPLDAVGRWVANSELSLFSDVYAAGACVGAIGGDGRSVAPWSSEWAERTGAHAARNMLGGREPFTERRYSPFEVAIPPLKLRLKCLGSVDGGLETYGFFMRSRGRGESSCGGDLLAGLLFYLEPSLEGQDRVGIVGCCVWDGVSEIAGGLRLDEAADLVSARLSGMESVEVADDAHVPGMDISVRRQDVAGILQTLAEDVFDSSAGRGGGGAVDCARDERPLSEDKGTASPSNPLPAESDARESSDPLAVEIDTSEDKSTPSDDLMLPGEIGATEDKASSPGDQLPGLVGKFARYHRPARAVPLRDSEVMFMGDDRRGAASGRIAQDKKRAALEELVKNPREI